MNRVRMGCRQGRRSADFRGGSVEKGKRIAFCWKQNSIDTGRAARRAGQEAVCGIGVGSRKGSTKRLLTGPSTAGSRFAWEVVLRLGLGGFLIGFGL